MCRGFHRAKLCGINGARTIDRLSDCVYNAADHCFSYGNGNDAAGSLYCLALVNSLIFAEKDDRYTCFLKVLRHAEGTVLELKKLTRHAVHQAAYPGDTVTDGKDRSGLILYDRILIILDLTADHLGYLLWF